MNTFQQQYLSILGAATGKKFLQAAETTADAAKDSLSKDKTLRNDMSEELKEVGYSEETNEFLTNETLRAQDTDPLSPAAKAYTEIQERTISLSNTNKQQLEEIAGLKARAESQQAVINKWAAKPHISRKQMKEFRKDIGGNK